MRNRIFGAIGVLWGSGILLGGIVSPPEGEGAYAAGQMTGLVLGGLLLIAGAYYLIKGGGKRAKRQPNR